MIRTSPPPPRLPLRSRLVAIGVTLLLAGTGIALVPASPAAAAIGCYADTCTGRDPDKMNCTDGTTIASFSLGANFYVELRLSVACYAAWARVTNTWYANGGSQNLFVEIDGHPCGTSSSCTDVYKGQQAFYGTDWTDMISFNDWVRACEVDYPGRPLNPISDCTPFH